jgi:hypothetical protein
MENCKIIVFGIFGKIIVSKILLSFFKLLWFQIHLQHSEKTWIRILRLRTLLFAEEICKKLSLILYL